MVRGTTWIQSLTIGLALACEATLPAQTFLSDGDIEAQATAQVDDEDSTDATEEMTSEEASTTETDAIDSNAADSGEMPAEAEDESPDVMPTPAITDEESDHAHTEHDHDHHADHDHGATASDADSMELETIKERFPNGSIKIERQVKQDSAGNYVNHGAWKMFDARGNVVAQGMYDNGERTGEWVRWYYSATEAAPLGKMPYQQFPGPFISQATFKRDQLDGAWTVYDAKMRKISQWTFVDGRRHGKSTWWFANGHKMREITFRDGEIDGDFVEWTPNNTVQIKDKYVEGRKLALKTAYHTGTVKKSEGMYLMARQVEQTPDDWWNFKQMTTTQTGKDEKHGVWTSWHTNGQRQLSGEYDHDVQVGTFVWWHANGQKALEGHFDHGKQDGSWTWWYASGQKSIRGEYNHGNPTGRWTWWKEDGKVAQSADLSTSEGVVIDMPNIPRLPEAAPTAPRTNTPPRTAPAMKAAKPLPKVTR